MAEFCGIDVGVRTNTVGIIRERRIIFIGDYTEFISEYINSNNYTPLAAGIDAPLSFPKKGSFRECERLLLKMGIRLFPSGAKFFRKVAERGIEIADDLRRAGVKVYEVYPYATRVILNLAPDEKKRTKAGLEKIRKKLSNYIDVPELNHNEVDAIIAALTVRLHYEGRGVIIEGSDGSILVPFGRLQHSLTSWQRYSSEKAYYSGKYRR